MFGNRNGAIVLLWAVRRSFRSCSGNSRDRGRGHGGGWLKLMAVISCERKQALTTPILRLKTML